MGLPAKRVPESVSHLAVEMVAAALIRHDANVRNAARALGVPSGDLRKLVLIDQRLADAALEAVELRLDDAEANLSEALRCGDPRRRDAASTFMLRNVQRAAKRGYAVAASAVSLEVNAEPARPVHYVVSWGKPDDDEDPDREVDPGEYRRDGRIFQTPRYGVGGDQRDDDGVVDGELSPSATLIEHEAEAVIEAIEPELSFFAANSNARPHRATADPSRQGGCLRRQVRPWRGGEDSGALRWTTFSTRSIRLASPPSVTNAIGSTSGSGTISSSTRTSSAVHGVVAGRIIAGDRWTEASNGGDFARALPSGLLR